MIGVWIMILAVLSAFATVPLGFGAASGVAFAIGLLIAWVAGMGTTAIALTRWVGSKLKFR
jgi:hypothetical protein